VHVSSTVIEHSKIVFKPAIVELEVSLSSVHPGTEMLAAFDER
jgi:hypothetical protein